MPQFAYVAREPGGAVIKGVLSAGSVAEAARQLRGDGKFPVRVDAATAAGKASAPGGGKAASASAGTGASAPAAVRPGNRVKFDDVIYFTSQLKVMVETGVSLAEALQGCRNNRNSPGFAKALDDVIEQVEGGSRFSAALALHPRVFPTLLVSLVRASEASGTLAMMLDRASTYMVEQRELTRKIRGAVTYPIAMLIFAVGVTVFLMTFVLPKFTAIYAGKEKALPAATRFLLSFSGHLKLAGPYLIVGGIVAVGGLVWHFRRPIGKRHRDWIKLHLPLMGKMFHKAYMARSLRTLGTMIESGVAMLEAVDLTKAACGNVYYAETWGRVEEELKHGRQLSEVLAESALFPSNVTQMIRAGEKSGKLGPVMERVAGFCESELAVSVKTATSMLEPLIITVLGAVIGGLVISLLLPIFTISRAMRP